jgi:hypothetical protein
MATEQYLTATEFRNITNLQSAEYSDAQLDQLLDAATDELDLRTGRTWQGVQTVTDELYDGDGTNEFYLKQTDIGSVTALSVDKDYTGSFTSVTTSYLVVYPDIGLVVLDTGRYSSTEVESFTKGYKTIKVSYTYGNASPTDFVKNLCAMIVLQQLRPESSQAEMIEKRISLLRANSISDI